MEFTKAQYYYNTHHKLYLKKLQIYTKIVQPQKNAPMKSHTVFQEHYKK